MVNIVIHICIVNEMVSDNKLFITKEILIMFCHEKCIQLCQLCFLIVHPSKPHIFYLLEVK